MNRLKEITEAFLSTPINPKEAVIIGGVARYFAGLVNEPGDRIDSLVSLAEYARLNDGVNWFDSGQKALLYEGSMPTYAGFSTDDIVQDTYTVVNKWYTEINGLRLVHKSVLVARDNRIRAIRSGLGVDA